MRLTLTAALAMALMPVAACAQHRGPPPEGRESQRAAEDRYRNSYANPSALIAAEIALNQLTRKEGLWTALRETAAPGAILLMPEQVDALAWLKDQPEPPVPVDREPDAVWMSCDGSYGAVRGGWTTEETSGHYASVWQRQEDGSYKWLVRHRVGRDGPVAKPDMISAGIADCDGQRRRPGAGEHDKEPPQVPAPVKAKSDYSTDGTLYWRSGRDAAGILLLLVRIRKDGEMRTVLGEELESRPGD
jgi:hypothetical protein